MTTHPHAFAIIAGLLMAASTPQAQAAPFFFTTGGPTNLIATASRPSSAGVIEVETADDFALARRTRLTSGTFTGLIPTGLGASDVQNVVVEIYRVFPLDSTSPPSGSVPTRVNSPSDVALTVRDAASGKLAFTTTTVDPAFTTINSVVTGINKAPNNLNGGEGSATGQEVSFAFTFTSALDLDADHYFFVPQVQLSSGDFLWLSAPRPIVAPGISLVPDLQSWIRSGNTDPDWLRIGTDITGQGPFNASFSLTGLALPEPATWAAMLGGFGMIGLSMRGRRRAVA